MLFSLQNTNIFVFFVCLQAKRRTGFTKKQKNVKHACNGVGSLENEIIKSFL